MEAVTPREDHEFLASVRSYYDRTTELYLRHLGTTLQAGVLSWRHGASGATQFPKHNLFFAERAGIRRGARILDAGCGVCGPSIDIASGIDDVCFDCVTISPVQASIAKQNVDHRGLRSRVRVQVGDYHHLPFQDDFFDSAVFFESACYSYDQGALFQEVRRVLTPAGRLYVKDVFVEDGVLSAAQAEELDQINSVYACRLTTLRATAEAVRSAGFRYIESADLSEYVDGDTFHQAMFASTQSQSTLSEFGQRHSLPFLTVRIHFGEVLATK